MQAMLWETRIANAEILRMNSNDGIYIPQNLVKGIMVMHHTDNIDWNEDTPDGKNSSHLLQVSTFQPSTNQP